MNNLNRRGPNRNGPDLMSVVGAWSCYAAAWCLALAAVCQIVMAVGR